MALSRVPINGDVLGNRLTDADAVLHHRLTGVRLRSHRAAWEQVTEMIRHL
jgi:hypothetical protein